MMLISQFLYDAPTQLKKSNHRKVSCKFIQKKLEPFDTLPGYQTEIAHKMTKWGISLIKLATMIR